MPNSVASFSANANMADSPPGYFLVVLRHLFHCAQSSSPPSPSVLMTACGDTTRSLPSVGAKDICDTMTLTPKYQRLNSSSQVAMRTLCPETTGGSAIDTTGKRVDNHNVSFEILLSPALLFRRIPLRSNLPVTSNLKEMSRNTLLECKSRGPNPFPPHRRTNVLHQRPCHRRCNPDDSGKQAHLQLHQTCRQRCICDGRRVNTSCLNAPYNIAERSVTFTKSVDTD